MAKFSFERLVKYLCSTCGEDLRWVANYNSQSFGYEFRHIRDDLQSDLTGNQLDYLIHRSLTVYNKRHAEEVYFHLGDADYLAVDYERGTAFHIFLDDVRGVTIMLEPDRSVQVPEFINECRDQIRPA